jgi:hypothetical protein
MIIYFINMIYLMYKNTYKFTDDDQIFIFILTANYLNYMLLYLFGDILYNIF